MTTTTTPEPQVQWRPTSEEVETIVASMRPIIQRFADRDRRLLTQWADAA